MKKKIRNTDYPTSFIEHLAAKTYNRLDYHSMGINQKTEGLWRARRIMKFLSLNQEFKAAIQKELERFCPDEAQEAAETMQDLFSFISRRWRS